MSVQKADKMPYVTRDMFYFCVGQIWLFIALIVIKLDFGNGSLAYSFLFLTAAVLGFAFPVLGIWEMKRRRAAESNRGES